MKALSSWGVLALGICGLLGCGGSGAGLQATDEQNLYAQIEGLGDAAGSDEMFSSAFVEGATPKNRSDYASRGYQIMEKATIEGDTASVPVKIFGGVYASDAGDRASESATIPEVETTWTLQKSGDTWKIKEAPLE